MVFGKIRKALKKNKKRVTNQDLEEEINRISDGFAATINSTNKLMSGFGSKKIKLLKFNFNRAGIKKLDAAKLSWIKPDGRVFTTFYFVLLRILKNEIKGEYIVRKEGAAPCVQFTAPNGVQVYYSPLGPLYDYLGESYELTAWLDQLIEASTAISGGAEVIRGPPIDIFSTSCLLCGKTANPLSGGFILTIEGKDFEIKDVPLHKKCSILAKKDLDAATKILQNLTGLK
jgi:hypothetical protein